MKIKAGQKMSFVVEGQQPKARFTLQCTGTITVEENTTRAELIKTFKEFMSNEHFRMPKTGKPFPQEWIKVKELKLITT